MELGEDPGDGSSTCETLIAQRSLPTADALNNMSASAAASNGLGAEGRGDTGGVNNMTVGAGGRSEECRLSGGNVFLSFSSTTRVNASQDRGVICMVAPALVDISSSNSSCAAPPASSRSSSNASSPSTSPDSGAGTTSQTTPAWCVLLSSYSSIKLWSFRNDAPMPRFHVLTHPFPCLSMNVHLSPLCVSSLVRFLWLHFSFLIPFTGLFCPAPKTWFSATPTTTTMVPASILFAALQGLTVPRCRRCDRGRQTEESTPPSLRQK